jgi:VWFA-related protein
VLLLDALNTPLSDQMHVRQTMINCLGTIKPSTTMAIFTLSSRLRMVTEFTSDPAALVKALKTSKANPLQSPLISSQQDMDTAVASAQQNAQLTAGGAGSIPSVGNFAAAAAGPLGAVQALQQFQADQISFQNDVRMMITLSAMEELAAYLRGIPGRKNVIWFSGAFPLVTFPDSSLFHSFANVSSYRDEIQNTADMLTRSRIAIYPVDARGLMTLSEFNASNASPVPDEALGTRFAKEGEQRYSEQAAMQEVAEETGGHAFVDTNDLDKAVASAVEHGSNYYTIAYTLPSERLDGKYHKIEVRVDGDRELKLAYRRGYYADAPGKPSSGTKSQNSELEVALAHEAPMATGILLQARVLPASDPIFQGVSLPGVPAGQNSAAFKGPAHRYIVDLTIDLHGLAVSATPEGDLKTAIEVAVVAYDTNGQPLNNYVHGFQIGIKAAQATRVMASGLPLRLPFDMPAGNVELRIGVHDLNAGHAGSLDIPLQIPDR